MSNPTAEALSASFLPILCGVQRGFEGAASFALYKEILFTVIAGSGVNFYPSDGCCDEALAATDRLYRALCKVSFETMASDKAKNGFGHVPSIDEAAREIG